MTVVLPRFARPLSRHEGHATSTTARERGFRSKMGQRGEDEEGGEQDTKAGQNTYQATGSGHTSPFLIGRDFTSRLITYSSAAIPGLAASAVDKGSLAASGLL